MQEHECKWRFIIAIQFLLAKKTIGPDFNAAPIAQLLSAMVMLLGWIFTKPCTAMWDSNLYQTFPTRCRHFARPGTRSRVSVAWVKLHAERFHRHYWHVSTCRPAIAAALVGGTQDTPCGMRKTVDANCQEVLFLRHS